MRARPPRVVMVGESAVGKTSLINYAKNGSIDENVRATTAANFFHYETSEFPIKVCDIWDTAGMEQYQALNSKYYESAQGAILTFDISSFASFERLDAIHKEVIEKAKTLPLIVVAANKSDAKDSEDVTEEEITEWCDKHGCKFFYTSAKTGENVIKLFDYVARALPESDENLSSLVITEDNHEIKHCC